MNDNILINSNLLKENLKEKNSLTSKNESQYCKERKDISLFKIKKNCKSIEKKENLQNKRDNKNSKNSKINYIINNSTNNDNNNTKIIQYKKFLIEEVDIKKTLTKAIFKKQLFFKENPNSISNININNTNNTKNNSNIIEESSYNNNNNSTKRIIKVKKMTEDEVIKNKEIKENKENKKNKENKEKNFTSILFIAESILFSLNPFCLHKKSFKPS